MTNLDWTQVLTAMDGVMAMDTLAVVRGSRSEKDGGGGGGGSLPLFLAGIFLDFHMPNMSGVECTKRIRQVSSTAGGLSTRLVRACVGPAYFAT